MQTVSAREAALVLSITSASPVSVRMHHTCTQAQNTHQNETDTHFLSRHLKKSSLILYHFDIFECCLERSLSAEPYDMVNHANNRWRYNNSVELYTQLDLPLNVRVITLPGPALCGNSTPPLKRSHSTAVYREKLLTGMINCTHPSCLYKSGPVLFIYSHHVSRDQAKVDDDGGDGE